MFDVVYSFSGSWLGTLMSNSPNLQKLQRWLFGILLIGFGARLGFTR
jgi:threonine/homoserine/homoserine lactone efflux protein